MSPGSRLRVLRAERRWSQRRVAAAVGMHLTRYWQVENGFRDATEPERRTLADWFGTTEAAIWDQEAA